jgi:hypothetical protein
MKLSEKRVAFTLAQAKLVVFAYEELGLYLAGDYWKRCPDCPKNTLKYSCHEDALAIDFIVYLRGIPLADLSVFNKLHDKWDELGGSERIEGDLGHFSFEHNGVR